MEGGGLRAGMGGDGEANKGTATPFAAMFPVEEALKAKSRVEEAISEKHKEMDQIRHFIADNSALINLVSRLPDELHYDIMVPFGRGAFFPGRLVHTNEFMVLLGEGYYVERSARQTLEILKRRGKALDSQVESLKANIKDFRAEASFFDVTASEAAEGIVEIREDFVEQNAPETYSSSIPDDKRESGYTVEDDDYARMMARLDELEKEELEAEGADGSDVDNQMKIDESDNRSIDDDYARMMARLDELEKEELEAEGAYGSDVDNQMKIDESDNRSIDDDYAHMMARLDELEKEELEAEGADGSGVDNQMKIDESDNRSNGDENMDAADGNNESNEDEQIEVAESDSESDEGEQINAAEGNRHSHEYSQGRTKSHQLPLHSYTETAKSGYNNSEVQASPMYVAQSSQNNQTTSHEEAGASSKDLIGSIVERTHSLQITSANSSPPSRPISRFKMQRR